MFRNLVTLSFLLFSGVTFSLYTFLIRIVNPELLTKFIFFQSTTVFLSFLVQAGLRAGLRNEYNLGGRRVVARVESFLRRKILFFTTLISVSLLFQNIFPIFVAFSVLQAFLTLLIGLRIAQEKRIEAIWYSILCALSIIVAGTIFLFLSEMALSSLRFFIESLSLFMIAIIRLSGQKARPHEWHAFKLVISRTFGIQIGSLLIYLLYFLVGQYVVLLSDKNLNIAIAYADIQVICGVQVLVISRLLMLYEKFILDGGYIGRLITAEVVWGILFSVGLGVVILYFSGLNQSVLYTALSMSFLGRLPLASEVQFIHSKYRKDIYVSAFLSIAGLLLATLFIRNDIYVYIALMIFSTSTSSIIVLFRSWTIKSGYFISRSIHN